ncbi:MAG: hypothetical protein ABIX01_20355 [Chitinophagaceae bacterium]
MRTMLLAFIILIFCDSSSGEHTRESIRLNTVTKIEMHLSNFGVESDGFPNIAASIDFDHDTSICKVSYYNPKNKDTAYRLTKMEIDSLENSINNCDLIILQKNYTSSQSDQPTSTAAITTTNGAFKIEDYGLGGKYPLDELYRIVYKLNNTFRQIAH